MPETTAEFTFAQLALLFPDVRCAPAGARALGTHRAGGRYIKEQGFASQHASVTVEIQPAVEFSVAFQNEWPPHMPVHEGAPLVQAILRGVFEAASRHDPAAVGCRVTIVEVGPLESATALGLSIAAAMAFDSAAERLEWEPPLDPRAA
jgi:hypothetical protein